MWESLRETGYLHWAGHTLDRIESRGFSLDIGIGREDCFGDLMISGDPLEEALVVESVWSDSLDRRYRTSEDMISSMIDSRALYREHIEIVLHDTQGRTITPRITTDTTERLTHIRHRVALFTLMYLGMQVSKSTRKVRNIRTIGLQQKKGELGGRLFSDPWEEVDHVDNSSECFWHRVN
jgi:hypothetical protein